MQSQRLAVLPEMKQAGRVPPVSRTVARAYAGRCSVGKLADMLMSGALRPATTFAWAHTGA